MEPGIPNLTEHILLDYAGLDILASYTEFAFKMEAGARHPLTRIPGRYTLEGESVLGRERLRSMIRNIDPDVCIGCGICAEFCPGDVIEMDGTRKARIAYPKDCWTCFSCEIACPVKAVDVHPFRKAKPMAWPIVSRRKKLA